MQEDHFPALLYRENNSINTADHQAVLNILDDTFGLDVEPLKMFDLFDPTYHSFSYFEETGICAANASTIDLPLCLNGNHVKAMSIQSVATRPSYRHRGLSQDLLRRVLEWCDERVSLVFLDTSIPDYYRPMGFRVLDEYSFIGDAPTPEGIAASQLLSWDKEEDRALLRSMLLGRCPVSEVASVCGLAGMFVLNAMGMESLQLYHLPALQVIVAVLLEEDKIILVDIVGKIIPSLAEILGAINCRAQTVETLFSPDLLSWQGEAMRCSKETVLMVRGDFSTQDKPFMLPPTQAF